MGILHTLPCPVEEEHQGVFFLGIVIPWKVFNVVKGMVAFGLPLFLDVHSGFLSFLGDLSCNREEFVIECRKLCERR